MLIGIIISLLVWLVCGLCGYCILSDQHYSLFKIGRVGKRNLKYIARIGLGPIFLMWAIIEYKEVKDHWNDISRKPKTIHNQYH